MPFLLMRRTGPQAYTSLHIQRFEFNSEEFLSVLRSLGELGRINRLGTLLNANGRAKKRRADKRAIVGAAASGQWRGQGSVLPFNPTVDKRQRSHLSCAAPQNFSKSRLPSLQLGPATIGQTEGGPIMNFIKTLTKGSKEPEGASKPEKDHKSLKMEKSPPAAGATAPPTDPKEQDPKDSTSTFSKIFRQKSLKDTQPAATNTAQEVDPAASSKANKVAPPAEAAESKVKAPVKNSKDSKGAPKETASDPSASKQKDSAFSRLFRPKVDPSKANTLEAAAKPDKAAKQEGKKGDKTSLSSCFKCAGPKKQ
ncbi:hypothetical protein AAFF_G00385930 [Aldrovandia affinis]|uniref:Uncharacterized protein n=1 Tax=Aldrovandia affinis TaxID=143900 RepID=A0AAD7SFI6_9TELE|nr:hypothetical protein AAFF_G00385930 [Aldrovandia affinis]